MNNIDPQEPSRWQRLRQWIHLTIDLGYQKENEHFTIEALKADVDFRGARIWILVCAILIASLGLNINSTAVIIGAMLISPLMGPIVGFGLGLGISDFELIKRSLRNLAILTLFSIATATIYFLVSPIDRADSEILARTQPTIYDVLIAFVGGIGGMLAISTRNKGNVATGVAIATALMPPLCTAGYGISQLNWSYFFGAFYLYLINSVFIALATFLTVRALNFPRKVFIDKAKEKHIRHLVTWITVITILPSIYFGVGLIRESIIEDGAKRFVREQLDRPTIQIISQEIKTSRKGNQLIVSLIGEELSNSYLDSIRGMMHLYRLEDTELIVKQGFNTRDSLDVDLLRSTVLSDLYENSNLIIRQQQRQIDSLRHLLNESNRYRNLLPEITSEVRSLFPRVEYLSIAMDQNTTRNAEGSGLIVVLEVKQALEANELKRVEAFLATRLKVSKIRIMQIR